jgi:sugar fermentation stimulation protein A
MTAPLLPYPAPVREVMLLRREKRFLVEVAEGQARYWVHTNNSGSMLGLVRPGLPALISKAANPKRKLAWTLEAVAVDGGFAGVNTSLPNRTLAAAVAAGRLPEVRGDIGFRPEVACGESRLDACIQTADGPLFVEAKNVTLVEAGEALFPDAPTERGRKHLQTLMRLAGQGARAALFFLVPHPGARCFAPADLIDPEYARLLALALASGVEAWAYAATVTTAGLDLGPRLAVRLPGERSA